MSKKIITLTTEKELKIVMFPLRQKILRELSILGRPFTAKQIADKLGITPSSAKHHLGKLQEIGVVSFDHNELINGITANYMKLNDVTIRIGQNIDNEFNNECDLFSENLMSQIYSQYLEAIKLKRTKYPDKFLGEFVSGVVHLSDEKMKELLSIVHDFIDEKKDAGEDTNPYEFALIGYRADLKDKGV